MIGHNLLYYFQSIRYLRNCFLVFWHIVLFLPLSQDTPNPPLYGSHFTILHRHRAAQYWVPWEKLSGANGESVWGEAWWGPSQAGAPHKLRSRYVLSTLLSPSGTLHPKLGAQALPAVAPRCLWVSCELKHSSAVNVKFKRSPCMAF